jgi:transposase
MLAVAFRHQGEFFEVANELIETEASDLDSHCCPSMRCCAMRKGIRIHVTASDRTRLEAIVTTRNSLRKHVWRAWIVLLSGEDLGTMAIMAITAKSKTCVWRWQERFMAEGVDGLLRDKTRPPGTAPLNPMLVDKVVALTLGAPAHEATHWTVRAMAKAAGIAASSVVKIWHDQGLVPHRWRAFKLSNDKAFAEKLHDVVGLYVSPSTHAIVLSADEKNHVLALDRTQPLPLKKGRRGTFAHDDKRNGTTTLFAALNVLDGMMIGKNTHRHQEFIRFLNALEAELASDKAVHVILDNYAAHKQPKVRAWLARHPRWTFHFVPTSCSWLNAIEGFFARLTRRRLKHGVFHSVGDLQAAINRFIGEHHQQPMPFTWKAEPADIIAGVRRGQQTLEPIH